jgi:sulfopyruvate decarboxylase TPP-binding subunit
MSTGISVCSRFITSLIATTRGVRRIQLSAQVPTGRCAGSTTKISQKSVASSSPARR